MYTLIQTLSYETFYPLLEMKWFLDLQKIALSHVGLRFNLSSMKESL